MSYEQYIDGWRQAILIMTVVWSLLLWYVRLRIIPLVKRLIADAEWYSERVVRIRSIWPQYEGHLWFQRFYDTISVSQWSVVVLWIAMFCAEGVRDSITASAVVALFLIDFHLVMFTFWIVDGNIRTIHDEYENRVEAKRKQD